jgi:DNA-binding MarR family transcriptional regulator
MSPYVLMGPRGGPGSKPAVPAPTVTALADALEAKGLVERRLDPSDRRVKTLARTAEGERLVRELDESLSRPLESLNRLSPPEQGQLLRLLSKAFGPNS